MWHAIRSTCTYLPPPHAESRGTCSGGVSGGWARRSYQHQCILRNCAFPTHWTASDRHLTTSQTFVAHMMLSPTHRGKLGAATGGKSHTVFLSLFRNEVRFTLWSQQAVYPVLNTRGWLVQRRSNILGRSISKVSPDADRWKTRSNRPLSNSPSHLTSILTRYMCAANTPAKRNQSHGGCSSDFLGH